MKLTLDTNCLINHFDASSRTASSTEALSTLIRYATSGRAQIAITTRVEADLRQDPEEARRAEMLRKLEMFEVIPAVLRWNESTWDSGDMWGDSAAGALADEVQKVLFPGLTTHDARYGNKIRDIDHIVAHVVARRDVFVTDDKRFHTRASGLNGLGCVVMRPAQCVDFIDSIAERAAPKTLPTKGINPAYHARALCGEVTFDYSNNNHRYALGEGHFLFETQWSKASDTSIYALHDAPSIDAVALVKDAGSIDAITDATAYDYSTRERKPKLGDIVLWRNANGLYAATLIVGIKDDSRSDDRDELTLQYRILRDGSDFSKPV